MQKLAEFHLAAASFPQLEWATQNARHFASGDFHSPPDGVSPSSSVRNSAGLRARYQRIAALRGPAGRLLQQAIAANRTGPWAERGARLWDMLPHALEILLAPLAEAVQTSVSLQPCLRDIHSEHVLFFQGQVTGLIDYGAMRLETVAGDLARLLGSWAGDLQTAWQQGLAAYESRRPLEPVELKLITLFDACTTVLGACQWLEWVLIEQFDFANLPAVLARFDRLMDRWPALLARGHL